MCTIVEREQIRRSRRKKEEEGEAAADGRGGNAGEGRVRRRVNEKLCLEEVQRHADRMLLLADGAADGDVWEVDLLLALLRCVVAPAEESGRDEAGEQEEREDDAGHHIVLHLARCVRAEAPAKVILVALSGGGGWKERQIITAKAG